MAVEIEPYKPLPWQSLAYYSQVGTDTDSNAIMHPVIAGFMIPDPANLTALARSTNANKAPAVGHFIRIFPGDWFQITAVDPPDHRNYRLTLAPFSG